MLYILVLCVFPARDARARAFQRRELLEDDGQQRQ